MAKKPTKYTVSDGKLVLTLEVAEEGGYIVTSPLDPDVLTQAETLEEAFENARDVIALFKEDRASDRRVRTTLAPKTHSYAPPTSSGKYHPALKPLKPAPRKRATTRHANPT